MKSAFRHEQSLPGYVVPSGWMYGPTTFLTDRFVPDVERIWLPRSSTVPGRITVEIATQNTITSREAGRAPALKALLRMWRHEADADLGDRPVLDLRRDSPANWAHAITNHLPVALLVRQLVANVVDGTINVVLPKRISGKIVELFELAGFEVVRTDAPVHGRIIDFDVEPWIAIRGIRHVIVKRELANTGFEAAVRARINHSNDKLLVSRKDTRRVTNEGELVEFFGDRGYKTVYPEEHSLIDQFALFASARRIAAVHGAGMAPLLMHDLLGREYELLEIFNPCHVTNVYRAVAHQTHGRWAGVRGILDKRMRSRIYSERLRAFSLSDFSVDLRSVTAAMENMDGI